MIPPSKHSSEEFLLNKCVPESVARALVLASYGSSAICGFRIRSENGRSLNYCFCVVIVLKVCLFSQCVLWNWVAGHSNYLELCSAGPVK